MIKPKEWSGSITLTTEQLKSPKPKPPGWWEVHGRILPMLGMSIIISEFCGDDEETAHFMDEYRDLELEFPE